MKNLLLFLFILIPGWAYAQDLIEMKDNTTLNARVVLEDKEWVTYITKDENTRSVTRVSTKDVKKIKYEKIPKSVNMIEITHDSLENEYLLNDIMNHLIVSGYIIEEFDNKYYSVSTQYDQNDRLTVEITGNKAAFRCFHLDVEDEVYPHATAVVAWGKKPKPGEKTGAPGSIAFKKIDALSRSYLKEGNGELTYKTEIVE